MSKPTLTPSQLKATREFALRNPEKWLGMSMEDIHTHYTSSKMIPDQLNRLVANNPDADWDNLCICGSTSLSIQGLLSREIGDIDIVSRSNFYSIQGAPIRGVRVKSSSSNFEVGGRTVKSFGITDGEDKFDVFYSQNYFPECTKIVVGGTSINLETISSVLTHKLKYIKSNFSDPELESSKAKHIEDYNYALSKIGLTPELADLFKAYYENN